MSQYSGGYGGGGYLTGGSPFGSGASPGGNDRREALSQSIRPVSIKQLHEAHQRHGDAPWQIEGQDVGHISLVAQVVQVRSQATNTVYWLDDGSGRIEARLWHDSTQSNGSEPTSDIESDSWVRATGTMRMYNGKKHLSSLLIHPVTDHNEIWYHLLEVIVVTLTFEKGAPNKGGSQENSKHVAGASAYTAQSYGSYAQDEYANLPPVQRSIVEWIRSQPSADEGYHIAAISRHVDASADEFTNALEALMENGTVFTTMNDTHVALAQ